MSGIQGSGRLFNVTRMLKKDIQPERTNRKKSIIDWGIAIQNNGCQKEFLVQ